MENKKENLFTENDISFYQKPYSENFPYNMVKMAAVEPVCFYPNREYIETFNNRKLNMKKLADYIYDENVKNKESENDIISKIKQPYYLPEYYNSTFVNKMPLIDILPAESIHESTNQYKQFEKLHYEEPAWTQAEKDLFNLLYNTIGKNFHKMAKEFENKATNILIPQSILKHSKVNISKESKDNVIATVTLLNNNQKINNDISHEYTKKRKHDTEELHNSKKIKIKNDSNTFQCQALPNLDNKNIHILIHNTDNQPDIIPRDNMIFPRKTSEIVHYYYKNKFNIPNWKTHKNIKTTLKKKPK